MNDSQQQSENKIKFSRFLNWSRRALDQQGLLDDESKLESLSRRLSLSTLACFHVNRDGHSWRPAKDTATASLALFFMGGRPTYLAR